MFSYFRSTDLLNVLFLYSVIHGIYAAVEQWGENYNVTGFDFAPDYSKDPFPPYPDLKDDSGKEIDVQNLRGVHLFGWKGCSNSDSDIIKEAYNDFHKLAQQKEIYNSIDWTDQAAKEFWGASAGARKIPNDRREQILQIYKAAQQVYNYPWTWQPPWLSWRQLWIEVRCSGGDGKGDPDNVCRDKKDDDACPGDPNSPVGQKSDMEAYTDNADSTHWYSRILFCNRVFNDLIPLKNAIDTGQKRDTRSQNNLEIWNNRARCFFHEVTHLDYFMNAPDTSPFVDDLQIRYKDKGMPDWYFAYGPYNAKLMRNRIGDGFYTQRNADSFAWFALAKYVQKEIGRYPNLPTPGSKKPLEAPKDRFREPIAANRNDDGSDEDLPGTEETEADHDPKFKAPGCGDRDPSTRAHTAKAPPPPETKCDNKNVLSGVPFNVFSGSGGKVYTNFCTAANGNKRTLKWTFDAKGNLNTKPTPNRRSTSRQIDKRTPPPNPDRYSTFNFELSWEPAKDFNRDKCAHTCMEAYDTLANSPCGHMGGQSNIMTADGSANVGCGTFAYKITGPDVPKPQDDKTTK